MIKQARQFYRLHREWLGEGVKPVEQAVADKRAVTCRNCPRHEERPLYEKLAGVAADTARRIVAYKNHLGLQVEHEDKLHVCGVCDCILRSKVWVPLKVLEQSATVPLTTEFYPPTCWQLIERAQATNKFIDDHAKQMREAGL